MQIAMTLTLAVAMACFMAYGVTGATLIFVLEFQLLSIFIALANEYKYKTLATIMIISNGLMLAQQIPYMMDLKIIGPSFGIFVTTLASFFIVYAVANAIKSASDMYRVNGVDVGDLKDDAIYLVLKRPKTVTDYITAIFGSNVSSVSFCINNKWLRFTTKTKTAEFYDVNDSTGYTFIDTGVQASTKRYEAFLSHKHNRWGLSNNCVTSWYSVTVGTVLEHKPWEWFPSTYVRRVINEIS